MSGNNEVDLESAVARLEVHLEYLKNGMDDIKVLMTNHDKDDRQNFELLDKRLTALEKKETWLSGKISGILFVCSICYILIKDFFLK